MSNLNNEGRNSMYYPDTSSIDTSFTGFTFNGVHSSTLGIVRVSDGSRYNDNMIPNFSDTTANVAGNDGTLYWESFYNNRPFTIKIAFDSVSETQYRRIGQVFNGKDYADLIFDERPYKKYHVKVQSPPQLQTLCFDEGGERVYKGEGTITFIAYYPFARSVYKYLNEYADSSYPNKAEWSAAAGLKSARGSYDGAGATVYVYNAGDVETDWIAYYPVTSSGCALTQVYLDDTANNTKGVLTFNSISRLNSSDAYMRINSATNLVEGCDSSKIPTGSLYNRFVSAGDFFKIPTGGDYLFKSAGASCSELKYDYLYY